VGWALVLSWVNRVSFEKPDAEVDLNLRASVPVTSTSTIQPQRIWVKNTLTYESYDNGHWYPELGSLIKGVPCEWHTM